MTEKHTYEGNCHCGRHRFTVTVPEIRGAISCSCTLCAKKGYLWLVPSPEESFQMTRSDGQMSEYRADALVDQVRRAQKWQSVRRCILGISTDRAWLQ